LKVRYPQQEREIYAVIENIVAEKTKVSRERHKMGRKLYSPKELNRAFRTEFNQRGYSELRDTYTITVPDNDIQITGAYKQIDFVKDNVLIEVQFGKYAFMFYDMAKFQYFFRRVAVKDEKGDIKFFKFFFNMSETGKHKRILSVCCSQKRICECKNDPNGLFHPHSSLNGIKKRPVIIYTLVPAHPVNNITFFYINIV